MCNHVSKCGQGQGQPIDATEQFMRRQPRFDNNRTAVARENNRVRAALAALSGGASYG